MFDLIVIAPVANFSLAHTSFHIVDMIFAIMASFSTFMAILFQFKAYLTDAVTKVL